MDKGKYLRIVGCFELIASVIGIIFGFVLMIGISTKAAWALQMVGSVDGNGRIISYTGFQLFITWLMYIAGCFFAPAVGILFLSVGDLIEQNSYFSNSKSKTMEEKASQNAQGNNLQAKNAECDLSELDSNKIHEPLEQECSNEQNAINDPASSITKNHAEDYRSDVSKKTIYDINDRIIFNREMEIDGVKIQKGMVGIVDNVFVGYGGRRYLVILEDSGVSVTISEKVIE